MAASVFISYSQKDESFRAALDAHLAILQHQGKVEAWHDRMLIPGQEWDDAIKQELEDAEVILLMVSADFIHTDYIWEVEIKRAMERHEAGSAVVIPIILRPCNWTQLPFGKLNALPDKARPITEWDNQDTAWLRVVKGLKRALDQRPKLFDRRYQTALHNLGRRNPFFTGREQELTQLDRALGKKAAVALTAMAGKADAQALLGLGGIGKSQLALEYAHRHLNEHGVVWWVRAETEQTLLEDVAALGKRLNLGGENTVQQAQAALGWMQQNPHWLLVLDNAPDPKSVKAWIPPNHGGRLLVTSRHRSGWSGLAKPMDVPILTPEEGRAFLLERLELEETATQEQRQAAEGLSRELGGLPLALEQAASYMLVQEISIPAYLERFRARGLGLLGEQEARPEVGEYDQTVLTTWALSHEQAVAETPMAGVLLNLLAFLDPDDIPRGFLWEWRKVWLKGKKRAKQLPDEEAYDRALGVLNRFSLIRLDGNKGTLSLHRLVGEVTRHALGEERERETATLVLAILGQAYNILWRDMAVRPEAQQLHPHALAVARHGERLGVDLGQVSWIYDRCASYWQSQGAFEQARGLFEHALAIAKKLHGPEHPDVAVRLNNLGVVLQDLGDFAGAREHFERALAIDEKVHGPEHPAVAARLNNLGTVLQGLGDLAGARGHFERALAIGEKILGPEHPTVATRLNNLGLVLQGLGDLAGARGHFERAQAISEKILGPEHPEVATNFNNLGSVLRDLGDLAGAREHFERAQAIDEKVYGPEHPHVAIDLNNLGRVLQGLGDLAGARGHFERAQAILRAKLPPGHPHIGIVEKNLARLRGRDRESGDISEIQEELITPRLLTESLTIEECLHLAFHLVAGRYASPDLLEYLDRVQFMSALQQARRSLRKRTAKEVLQYMKQTEEAIPPSPLWLSYMEIQYADTLQRLCQELEA